MGYQLQTSKLLFISLFCIASKNSLFMLQRYSFHRIFCNDLYVFAFAC